MDDGSYGSVTSDQNPLGIVYTLNFSVPFALSDNITAAMGVLYKASAGTNANNLAPNYIDGAMLANDAEWFLYGGLLRNTDAYAMPHADEVQCYQADQYGVDKPAFRPGFVNVDLPSPLTRYLAYGAAANAPSENKAWYFAGLHAPGWGPIYTVSANDSLTAINASNTLIELDMAVQQQETWTNTSLPDAIHGRANPELVWVPVGEQGLLVALGGVVDPEFVTVTAKSRNTAASAAESPAFLATIDVYDVASKTWFQQPAAGDVAGLGQRTRACAVVATAADASSFNIYYYGGFDGLDPAAAFNDDVWVLSLPSFTWTRVAAGTDAHARAGHKCVTPYPDQMLVVGGYTAISRSSAGRACVAGNIVQLFNLSSATWMDAYTPTAWSPYAVPDALAKVIGGGPHGGATLTAPAAPGGWADDALADVFATAYPTSRLNAYYPYPLNASATSGGTLPVATGSGSSSNDKKDSSHLPSYVAPLVGVIGGLVVLSACGIAFLLYRRRRVLTYSPENESAAADGSRRGRGGAANTESVATYDTGRNFVFSWLRAQPSVKHTAMSSTSPASTAGDTATTAAYFDGANGSTPLSPEMAQANALRQIPQTTGSSVYGYYGAASSMQPSPAPAVEAGNTYISEMIGTHPYLSHNCPFFVCCPAANRPADTSHRVELPADYPGSFGNGGPAKAAAAESSAELESPLSATGSGTTTAANSLLQPAAPAAPTARADSPSLGQVASLPLPQQPSPQQPASSAFRESTISELSETDRRHLRQDSDGGMSTLSVLSVPGASGSGLPSSTQPIPEETEPPPHGGKTQ